MNEIVKYSNFMNELRFGKFTPMDYNFLMALCSRMRDRGAEEETFSFAYIKQIAKADKNWTEREFVAALARMNRKLMAVTCEIETETEILQFVLFPTFRINKQEKTLTVAVNERFRFVLNELSQNFTRFELEEFAGLDSKYSKTLYRLLKQYRTTGSYHAEISELRALLGCPESYTNHKLYLSILKPAVEELGKEAFPDLTCVPVYAQKKGRPVIAYQFVFHAEKAKKAVLSPAQKRAANLRKSGEKPVKKPEKARKNAFNDFGNQRHYTPEELAQIEALNSGVPGQMDVSDFPDFLP
ncbi:MAG: replication initiation protein [Succinimonas sp.]|nr:replication initiation protein [Succinimonas sp.]